MFRLPSLAEIFSLFTKSRTVAEAASHISEASHARDVSSRVTALLS